MEFVNRIELCGVVGAVRTYDFHGNTFYNFSLCVNSALGNVVETNWFNCKWCPGKDDDAGKIVKDNMVHLEGRFSNIRYTGADGNPAASYEVKVQKVY